MPSRRRLTLAPAVRAKLRPTQEHITSPRKESPAECARAREALSAAVAVAVEESGRPKPRHGVQPLSIKFWTADTDTEEEDDHLDSENDSSTAEFIAAAAG
jgi:hypothetical protein